MLFYYVCANVQYVCHDSNVPVLCAFGFGKSFAVVIPLSLSPIQFCLLYAFFSSFAINLKAAINFNDGLGGGNEVMKNVLFNFCRESSDHGPFNSWDRVVYLFDGKDGTPTVFKKNDTISFNWILANYHSSMAIDNDDGEERRGRMGEVRIRRK